jgi:hypothetical protein
MAETVFAGEFGYRLNGISIEQICLLNTGGVHNVTYDRTGRTLPGEFIEDFSPATEKVYTYAMVRRALQKARTAERLFGTISLIGPAGDFTRLGERLGQIRPLNVRAWIKESRTFNGQNPDDIYDRCVALYAEVNPSD